MNILHLTKDYIKINGITTMIENLIAADKQNRHFIQSNFIEDTVSDRNDIVYSRMMLSVSTRSIFSNIFKIAKVCKQNHIDIIHCHHRYFDFLAATLKQILNVNIVTTVHSKVCGKKMFSYNATKMIAVGQSIKRHLVEHFDLNEKEIVVINNFIIPNDIVFSRSKDEIIKELKLDSSKYVIGYVGRFDKKEKGIDLLLTVSRKIVAEIPNIVFIFIGDGVDKQYLLNSTKEQPERYRIIEAQINVFNYMQIFNQFVLPSRIDPFPLVMLEAAYLKIPFIGSNVDGIKEFVDDNVNGLLFKAGSEDELYEKIICLYKDKDYSRQLADNLHKKVIKKFTADVIIPQYNYLYENLLKN